MANRWGNNGKNERLYFAGAPNSLQMVTAAVKLKDACSLEEKLWPTQTVILKSRDITLPTNIHLVKAVVFPVVMYGCDSWIMNKAEHRSSSLLWTVVLEKTLESPWNCKEIQPVHPKGDQSWVCIGRTEVELKLQYFGHLMWRADSFEKTLMLGKIQGGRRRDNRGWDGWMASQTQWTWVWVNSGSWWWTGRPGVLQSMGWQRVGHNWATELTDSLYQSCL